MTAQEFDVWVYADRGKQEEVWIGSHKETTKGDADVKALVSKATKFKQMSDNRNPAAIAYARYFRGCDVRHCFMADHIKEQWKSEQVLDEYCVKHAVRRFHRIGKNLRQVVPKAQKAFACRYAC